jgi:hypothetical protein
MKQESSVVEELQRIRFVLATFATVQIVVSVVVVFLLAKLVIDS